MFCNGCGNKLDTVTETPAEETALSVTSEEFAPAEVKETVAEAVEVTETVTAEEVVETEAKETVEEAEEKAEVVDNRARFQ